MPVLCTVGYEGRELEGFIAELKAAGVTHVADVRERPSSRKAGFSKTPFSAALAEAGLGYSLWRELGTPPDIRNRYKADHDTATFFADYSAHLAEHGEALDALAELAARETVVLLCYEADPAVCHRTITAQKLCERAEFEVREL